MQLLLFPESKEERMFREIKELKDQCERVRKSQYAKIGQLTKMYQETKHELDTLKIAICKNKI
jgi:hypothetical protein